MSNDDDELDELSEDSSYFVAPIGGQSTDIIGPKDSPNPEGAKARSYVSNSELVKRVQHGASPADLLSVLIKEAADDVAFLGYERSRAYREGKNVTNVIAQRSGSMRALVELIVKKQEGMKNSSIDLTSPKFKKVLDLWMEFVYDTLVKVGTKEADIDVFFKTMKADMTDWEKKVIDL